VRIYWWAGGLGLSVPTNKGYQKWSSKNGRLPSYLYTGDGLGHIHVEIKLATWIIFIKDYR